LKISSTTQTKSKSVDSHDILVPVKDIQNFNGYSVRITHFTDDGIQDNEYIQEVTVQDGYVLIPDVEFSSIIVDGFTGTKTEVSFNVNVTDTSFTVTENGSLTITLDGVPDGVEIDFTNSSTIPQNADILATYATTSPFYSNFSSAGNSIDEIQFATNTSYSIFAKWKWINATVPNYVVVMGDSSVASSSYYYNKNNYYGIAFRPTGYIPLPLISSNTSSLYDGYEHSVLLQYYSNNVIMSYIDALLDGYLTTYPNVFTLNNFGRGYYTNEYNWNGTIADIVVYNNTLTDYNRIHLTTGYSGTSAKLGENGEWQHVINGQIQFDNVTAGETIYLLSADDSVIATSLTKEYSYTQDYTLISETETAASVTVQINATAGANMSESQLVYDVASSNFTYNMSISSDNSNVTGTYHNGTVTLDTGLLNFGDSFNYTLTFDKLAEGFTFWTNWISKTSTKAVVEYKSSNSNVENDFYLENMTASSTFDFKYSNGTILANATSDSDGYLKFDDVGGVTDTYKLINDTYTIEKQTSTVSFVAVVFAGLSFVGLYFANRFRRR
jgi:hypothetical protein